VEQVTVNMSAAQATALGLDVKAPKRTPRTTAHASYRTYCTSCLMEFTTRAAEDRHVAPGHNRFSIILE
jgi:hypothetical protein